MTLTVAFRNFVNTPKKLWENQLVQQINGTHYFPVLADNVTVTGEHTHKQGHYRYLTACVQYTPAHWVQGDHSRR